MKIQLSIVVASLCLSAYSLPAVAEDGWYAAADVGQSHFSGGIFDDDQLPARWTRSTNDTATGYRLTGGYQLTPNWGVEAGYVDLGHGTHTGTNRHPDPFMPDATTSVSYRIGAKGFFAAGVGTWVIDPQWSLFARAGVIDGRLDTEPHANGLIFLQGSTDTTWKTTYGVGGKWNVQPQWSLRLGWDSYRQLGGQYDLSLLSLGVEWHFF